MVALLGSRVPAAVKLLLLTLAIVDDIGAIAVIALFYSDGLDGRYLLVAVVIVVALIVFHRGHVVYPPVLVVTGLALWLVVYESGVHATVAGVAMGLVMPARPLQTELEAEESVDVLEGRPDLRADDVRATAALIRGSVSTCDRLIDVLHPWTSFVIVPIFALANAGITLSGDAISNPSHVLIGVVAALVVGKLVGVTLFGWLTVRLGLGRLPDGMRWIHLAGVGAVAGVGFTVSLFVAALAFDSAELRNDAKIGTLLASAVAAVLGTIVLVAAGRRRSPLSQPDRRRVRRRRSSCAARRTRTW